MKGGLHLTLLFVLTLMSSPPALTNPLATTPTTVTDVSVMNSDDGDADSILNLTIVTQDSTQTSARSTEQVLNSSTPLKRCQYEYKSIVRNELFEVDGNNLPLELKYFYVADNESSCFLSRRDLESKLDPSSSTDQIINVFLFGCLNPLGTDVTFLEDEEADELERASIVGEGIGSSDERNASYPYRWYRHVISYFQTSNCRINLKGVDIVANMSELRVLSVNANNAWDLIELQEQPELCRSLRNVVAFSILGDWSTETYLHHLAVCKEHLTNVVEMDFSNDSLSSFPEVLYTAVPNLRALEISNNKFTSPVDFPWPSGFAALPRNLSRTYQYNVHYNFANSFDMDPHLFRRVFLMNSNNITNLTDFRFHSDFQYISIQRNGLREIAAGVFDDVPSLQFLSLAYNDLESLPGNLFARLVNLRRLDLQGNKFVTLPTNIFWTVRKLQHLNLEENRLEVLQEGLFGRLEDLTQVKLKNNSIVEVKKEAFTTLSVKLKTLELQNNPLKTFPVIVLLLRGLTHTNLENTDIEVLDFVQISRQTSLSIFVETVKNPTTGDFVDLKDNPEFQKIISLKRSKLRSVVLYNDTRETVPMFLQIVKYFTIEVDDSRLACDCHILNVTHQLAKGKKKGTLTDQEACLRGWKCVWPPELAGKLVASLQDQETYCPLEESVSGGGGSRSTSCPEGCTCYLRTKVNTVIVDCQNRGLRSVPATVPDNTRELWLQNNTVQNLQASSYLKHLTSLKLTSNNLQDLPIDVLLQIPELTVLHLDDNWLTGLKPDFRRLKQLNELRLAGNPFRCDCTTLWMKQWILSHQMITTDWSSIKCTTQDDDGQVFLSVPDHRFVCKVSATLTQLALPLALPLSFAFLLLTLLVVAFIQRRRLKILLYIHTGYHPFDRDQPDQRAAYDVSVFCDVTARAWVLRHVIESLEERGRYKVFFYSRDAFAGASISDNVRYCVRKSRRMVVVLGKEWGRDEAMVTAVHEALARCHKDLPHFLTVVLHHYLARDIRHKELGQYVHKGRYISTQDKHFVKKLIYEMPHVKTCSKKEAEPKKNTNDQKEEKKKKGGGAPEPVALYDIVALAEQEANAKVDYDPYNAGALPGGNVQQVSSDHDVDVDLRHSGTEQRISDDVQGQQIPQPNAENGHNNRNMAPPKKFQNQMSVESQKSQLTRSIFVWYAHNDLPYTMKNIVEPLERRGHVCTLEDRDFPLGAAIQENIVRAVENSTRCIFVLSNQTAANDWFNFAFHVAFDRCLQSPDDLKVALVSREDCDVTKFVDEVQQVVRSSAILAEGEPWFWKRLQTFVHLDQVELA